MSITVTHVRRDPKLLKRLPVNARFMTKETYDTLVANIKADGCLTQWPMIWAEPGSEEGSELVLSGNHRCDAAVDAGLTEIDATLLEAPGMTRAEQVARALSHNSIAGEDDLATLKLLYDEIDDVNWKAVGLDDKQLELLDEVSPEALSEAQLDYQSVLLMFLPPEAERAKLAIDKANITADETWAAALPQYEPFMDALETARDAYGVGNIATALGVIFAVFEAHLTDMRDGYLTEDGEARDEKRWVPFETMIGTRRVPAGAAAVIVQAIKKVQRAEGDVKPWQAIEYICAEFLGGA